MKFDRYVSNASNIFAQNRLLKFVTLVLAALICFVVIQLGVTANNQKVILVPAGLSDRAEVGDSSADETYLSAMGVYIATLLYSTTAVSVEPQYKLLTGLFSTEAYTRYSEALLTTAASQAKNMVSFTLKINKISIQTAPESLIRVSVSIDKYIFSSKAGGLAELRDLVIGFKLVNGRFYITSLEEEKHS